LDLFVYRGGKHSDARPVQPGRFSSFRPWLGDLRVARILRSEASARMMPKTWAQLLLAIGSSARQKYVGMNGNLIS